MLTVRFRKTLGRSETDLERKHGYERQAFTGFALPARSLHGMCAVGLAGG
jgi:hypothetical protein